MKKKKYVVKYIALAFLAAITIFSLPLYPQNPVPDSKGTDFWLTYLPNFHSPRTSGGNYSTQAPKDSIYIFIVASEACSGTIEYYDEYNRYYSRNFTITNPAIIYTFKLCVIGFELESYNRSYELPYLLNQDEVIAPQSFHVTSTKDITVYAHSMGSASSESFIVLPTDAIGKNYFVMSYNSDGSFNNFDRINTGSTPSQFAIVATEDSTNVFISPSTATYKKGINLQTVKINGKKMRICTRCKKKIKKEKNN